MAAVRRRLPALAVLCFGSACAACPPEIAALRHRPDFATPLGAARSLLAATAASDALAQYRCLAEAFKREHGLTADALVLAQRRIHAELGPALRYACRLEPAGEPQPQQEGTLLWFQYGGRLRVGFLLEEQPYLEIRLEGDTVLDSYLDRPPPSLVRAGGAGLQIELPEALRAALPAGARVRRLELGSEWKLRRILPPPEP